MLIKFTVVIPTRERADMLYWSIMTCITQKYQNLEILISDNFSQDNTFEVVNSFKDSRIKYVNTTKRLSMSHNYEFALRHVNGDYVLFLGDDDGLMPDALNSLNEIIQKKHYDAVTWDQSVYYWPNFQDSLKRNLFYVNELVLESQELNAQKQLEKVVFENEKYRTLAWLYGGCVSMDIINKIKDKCNGTFCHSLAPDVFSAIAITSSIENYYFSKVPFSIRGVSSQSTGYSQANVNLYPEANNKFFSEEVIPFHSELLFFFNGALITIESVYQCVDLGLLDEKFKIGLDKLAINALKEARFESEEKFNELKCVLIDIATQTSFSKEKLKNAMKSVKNLYFLRKINTIHNFFVRKFVDVSRFKITNVYEMSLYSKNIASGYFTKYNFLGKLDTLRKFKNNI